MKENLYPQHLTIGSTIGITSPSGSIGPSFVDGATKWFTSRGFNVQIASHALNENGRFCGTIEERLSDIQSMINNPNIDAIFCSRGGYGIVHLLEKLDLSYIRQHPKWLIGYSDITALHLLLLQNGLVSLHAPMAKHLTENGDNKASQYLNDILLGEIPSYSIPSHPLNIEGETEGVLVGGNLAVLASLLGSEYAHIPKGAILFIEDIGERAYAIDRMLWNLKLAKVFDQLSGVIIGQFTDCDEDPKMYESIYASAHSLLKGYNIPIAFNFPGGHVAENYPLMHGAKYKLCVNKKTVVLDI